MTKTSHRIIQKAPMLDNINLDGLTHQEAISLIKSGGNHLTILLKRGNGTVPELVKEAISSPHKR